LGLKIRGNIQATFREHSGNIQGTFREHSGNIQGNCDGREWVGPLGLKIRGRVLYNDKNTNEHAFAGSPRYK
jgi:hypothetical protein